MKTLRPGTSFGGTSLRTLLVMFVLVLAPTARLMAAQAPDAGRSSSSGQNSTPDAQAPEQNGQEVDENDAYKHSAIVKTLGAKLGLNSEQAATTFEVVNFILLAGLVGLFLTRSLPKVFRSRTGLIQKHLVDARMATEEATARMSSVEDRLSKLDRQIASLKAQAESDSAAEEQRFRSTVEDEKQKILAGAEQEIAAATTQARRQIQQFAAELAIDQAAKKLVVTAETDRLLVQSFARRLMAGDEKEGQN